MARRFHNQYTRSSTSFKRLLKWRFGFIDEPFALFDGKGEAYVHSVVKPNFEAINKPQQDAIQVTWVGHTTFLLQVAGVNFLTDPHFSKRASPLQWLGPKRMIAPALALEDLPHIDMVVISHDHYDHLDLETVKKLGNAPHYAVPLGLKKWFSNIGITNVVERNWWESFEYHGLTLTAVPVQHFSGRVPFRFNQTLWSGWVIEGGGKKIFFGGDTGYSKHFHEIYERFGPMDLSLLPIGAYHPRTLMKTVHVDPREAVEAHKDLHSKQSIGMHWGTFRLTTEPTGEPPAYLNKVLEEEGLSKEDFRTLSFGETFTQGPVKA